MREVKEILTLVDGLQYYLDHCFSHDIEASTINGKKCLLERFVLWCLVNDVVLLKDINLALVNEYRLFARQNYKGKTGEPIQKNSLRNIMTAIKVFIRCLYMNEILDVDPLGRLELPKAAKRVPSNVLEKHQVTKVFEIPLLYGDKGMRDRAILETFYASGVRRKELINLRVSDINFEKGELLVFKGKGDSDRKVPIAPRTLMWLKYYIDHIRPKLIRIHSGEQLFLNSVGKPFTESAMSSLVSKYIKAAGYDEMGSCNTFRHSAATHMLEGGASLRYIQEFLGHASISTTQIYTKVSIKQLHIVYGDSHPANHIPLDERVEKALLQDVA